MAGLSRGRLAQATAVGMPAATAAGTAAPRIPARSPATQANFDPSGFTEAFVYWELAGYRATPQGSEGSNQSLGEFALPSLS